MRLWLFCLLCFFDASAFAQNVAFRGRVTDERGQGLPYASLSLSPGSHSTITNESGRFEIYLPAGNYTLQLHYLGFNALKVAVELGNAGLIRDFALTRQVFELGEIKVNARAEDPAYAIMRRAIRNAPLHHAAVSAYEAKTYVKGSLTVTKAPWAVRKLMEQQNIKMGTTYLLESVSEVKYRFPATFSEKVVSIRSNLPPGSSPTINFANFNFYRPNVGDIISPLSGRAFANYRFAYRGEKQEGNLKLVRIGIEARTKGPYLLSGDIYLLEPSLAIHALDVRYRDDNGVEYHLQQEYQAFEEVWMPVKQDVKLKANYLGANADIRYVTSVRNYRVTTNAEALAALRPVERLRFEEGNKGNRAARDEARKMKKQTEHVPDSLDVIRYSYEVDTLARVTPDSMWSELRQMPLEENEIIGYREADSIYVAKNLKADTSGENNRFKWYHPITGHTYRLGPFIERVGYSKQLSYRGLAFDMIQRVDFYNTVEGVVLGSHLRYTTRKSRTSNEQLGLNVRYAFARDRLLTNAYYERNRAHYQWKMAAGTAISQYNNENPISPAVNLVQTLLYNDNILKLYEKSFVEIKAARNLNPQWQLKGGVEYQYRSPLQNQARFAFFTAPGRWSENAPANLHLPVTAFNAHHFIGWHGEMEWRPWAKQAIINGEERVANRNKPIITFQLVGGHTGTTFWKADLGISQYKSLQKGNSLTFAANAGFFISPPQYFLDFNHFNAFQSLLQSSESPYFRNLPVYQFSTNASYLKAFGVYRFGRLALTQWHYFRTLGIDEAFFASALYTPLVRHAELGYNISGPFRLVGVDFFISANNILPIQGGVRFGVRF